MISSNMDFDRVTQSLGKTAASREASIMTKINTPGFGNNISELIALQVETSLWTVCVGATQNVVKDIGDAMKSVIQKG